MFYELDVTIKWEGTLNSTGLNTKGTIHMPYISEENDDDDFEVKLTVEGDSKDHDKLKDLLRKEVIPILKQKVPAMLKALREVAIGSTKLPPKQQPSNKLDKLDSSPVEVAKTTPTPTPTPSVTSKPSSGPRVVSITVSEKFVCRPMDLFQCFIEPNRVKAYAGGDATIEGTKGGKFSLFGGAVKGEFAELEPPSKIVQKWRFASWPEGHFSTVTMEFEEKNGKTNFKLTQTGIPEDDKERTEGGWKDNFLRRIKGVFGYGSLS
jgi:activator of HSP90 ATPase